MNLSEIRKKAQQERQEGAGQTISESRPSAPPDAPAAESSHGGAPPVPPSEPTLSARAADRLPEPSHTQFDPIPIIMAGRQTAMQTEDPEASIREQMVRVNEEYEECLCFRVATERYAINIMEIKEIAKPREVTEVPRVPGFVAGVISLRGVIVPIFDLARRLKLAPVGRTKQTRVIVVKRGEEVAGILVDEVIQVVRIPASSIEHPPAILEGIDREFVRGIGRHDGTMLILLHLGTILDLSLT